MASQTTSVAFLPGLLEGLERTERRWISPPRNALLRVPHLLTGALRFAIARLSVRLQIRRALRRARHSGSALMAEHSERLTKAVSQYARRRLDTGRRIAEFKLYSQLFSLWHVLHLPLFFMLLIAGIVHVVAINVY